MFILESSMFIECGATTKSTKVNTGELHGIGRLRGSKVMADNGDNGVSMILPD